MIDTDPACSSDPCGQDIAQTRCQGVGMCDYRHESEDANLPANVELIRDFDPAQCHLNNAILEALKLSLRNLSTDLLPNLGFAIV
jgi:hypothetical protein